MGMRPAVICSGLMYAGVPTNSPVTVIPGCSSIRARPKSVMRQPAVGRQQQVGWLDVPMGNALLVGVVQGVGHVGDHGRGPVEPVGSTSQPLPPATDGAGVLADGIYGPGGGQVLGHRGFRVVTGALSPRICG